MKSIQISSVPLMELLQEACEALVINQTVLLPHECNTTKRDDIIAKRQKAIEMAEHLREVIKANETDV